MTPYLTSVNLTIFQEYLNSPEYNDPTLRNMISINLYQSPNYIPICEETIGGRKLR